MCSKKSQELGWQLTLRAMHSSLNKAYGINAGSIPACFTMRKHNQHTQLFINHLKTQENE
jgi:hypothetical protein